MTENCSVSKCRQPPSITHWDFPGKEGKEVRLCTEHFEKFCNGNKLKLKKRI